jgi:CBS domain containing-hemolysin-like protein
VGQIRDEHDVDEIPPIRPVKPRVWAVRGDVSLKELEERLEVDIGAEESRTIGGFIAEELGRVPEEGDVVERVGVRIRVVRTEENRVVEVRITVRG